jgi:tetratricopeptide (TPR) repeat protein
MAKTKKASSKNGGNEILESSEALAEQLSRTEQFLEDNKTVVFTVIGLIVAIIAGYIGFNYYTDSRNQVAQRELFQAVYYFEADSLGKALNGDGNSFGFLEIADEYAFTDAANLASFYAGATYMKMGDFESAIRNLDKFSSDDLLVQSRAFSLTGDAYVEIDDLENAVKYYEKAASNNPNAEFTPIYLIKGAVTYEAKGDVQKAIAKYKRIVDEYPNSTEYQEALKQKSRLEGL